MSDIYRDPSEGAAAKRQDLLRRRRDELATMPHAIRRVVVARQARAAAGLAMTLGGLAMLATAVRPSLAAHIDSILPGVQPASISTMLFGAWLLAVIAYMVSRARSEHRFAVAMSHYVLPGRDLDYDLQRLDHEHPDDMARSMAHDREVSSVGWLVLGASLVMPATALYAVCGVRVHGWPVMREFETSLATHGGLLLVVGVVGAIAALVMTTRLARTQRAMAIELAAVAAIAIISRISALPIAVAVAPFAMGVLGWRLVRERVSIAAIDPAEGSELFNLRDALRSIWRAMCAVGRVAGKPATLRAAVATVVVVGGWQYLHHTKKPAPIATPAVTEIAPAVPATTSKANKLAPAPSKLAYNVTADGRVVLDTKLEANATVTIPDLVALGELPPRWGGTIEVTSMLGRIEVATLGYVDSFITVDATPHVFEIGCTLTATDVGLRLRNQSAEPQSVTLSIKATIAPCAPSVE